MFDLFGIPVTFYIKKKPFYNSILGTIFSIIIYTFVVYSFVQLFIDMIGSTTPIVTRNLFPNQSPPVSVLNIY